MMLNKITLHILLMYFLLHASESLADFPTTMRDFSLLPPFCLAQMKPELSPPGAPTLWSRRLPGGYAHIHHFCSALHTLNLAQRMLPADEGQKKVQRRLFETVTGGIKYMEDNADPQFVLYPQMYATKAEALFALDQPGGAVNYLTKAIEKNKKFTKAYGKLADYYIKTGDKKSANDILQEGLKHSPNSKILHKKLNALSK
jgi:tetratricopeptide (TPR) repeat protein